MPYEIYKLIHYVGIFGMLTTLAVAAVARLPDDPHTAKRIRRARASAHGTFLFFILLGGFGMLARLGVVQTGLPGWVYVKLGIWLIAGATLVLANRRPDLRWTVLVGVPLLAVIAAAVALYKPL